MSVIVPWLGYQGRNPSVSRSVLPSFPDEVLVDLSHRDLESSLAAIAENKYETILVNGIMSVGNVRLPEGITSEKNADVVSYVIRCIRESELNSNAAIVAVGNSNSPLVNLGAYLGAGATQTLDLSRPSMRPEDYVSQLQPYIKREAS